MLLILILGFFAILSEYPWWSSVNYYESFLTEDDHEFIIINILREAWLSMQVISAITLTSVYINHRYLIILS